MNQSHGGGSGDAVGGNEAGARVGNRSGRKGEAGLYAARIVEHVRDAWGRGEMDGAGCAEHVGHVSGQLWVDCPGTFGQR